MPPSELVQQVGPLAAWGLMALASLLVIARTLAPDAFQALVDRLRFKAQERAKFEAHRREMEAEAFDAERQEDVTLWLQMVRLQTQTLKSNEQLLTWLTKSLDGDLKELADAVQAEMRDIRQNLASLARQQVQETGELRLQRMELTRIGDELTRLQEKIVKLANGGRGNNERAAHDGQGSREAVGS